jgi:arylsulfatase A-like enzyme
VVLLTGAVACVEPGPPNVVLMISDDQGYTDFGFMGSEHVRTPNLDALAASGTVFTLAHATSSTCRPALASLLTGLYPYQWEARVRELTEADPELDPNFAVERVATLPRLLEAKGYVSFQAGKYWEGTYATGGFSAGVTAEYDPDVGWGGAAPALRRESLQAVYAFIDAHRSEPFFVWFAPMVPHIPHDPPEELLAAYDLPGLSKSARRYFASCTWFDRMVGDLVLHLERRGLRENTLLIYVSDNGWEQRPAVEHEDPYRAFMGGKRGKGSLHDLGFRTPIVLSLPVRVPSGRVVEELVSTVDLLPTALDYAGVPIPAFLPGVSIRPLVEGTGGRGREFLVGSVNSVRPIEERTRYHFVGDLMVDENASYLRSRRWHFIQYEDRGIEELYDVQSDPDEEHDVARSRPDLVERFRAEIAAWKDRVLDTARRPTLESASAQ